ncbi:hypothetical protein KXD40_007580 [Peronospora effusa]|uniref:Uncharacterized protein n=1 Tax=Peronospora effusa TaxID=542832 RepID=A0A3M6VJZ2_9STRA|nr:hypothetical protein DD238_002148 [Peronospora effusa]RQM16915.1 hypothetical protein DD237_002769 [Peronospora effusa]UIZ29177.1 hypothetical protein KXD40_007580 [Peronospora effusa]
MSVTVDSQLCRGASTLEQFNNEVLLQAGQSAGSKLKVHACYLQKVCSNAMKDKEKKSAESMKTLEKNFYSMHG